jgi:hypothetical protein
MKAEFEWAISAADRDGLVMVRERLIGTDKENIFGPLHARYAESFIRARRSFVERTIKSRVQAFKIFEPQQSTLH